MAAAAVAVVLVLALRRSGDPLPEVYLGSVWSALVLPGVGLLLVGRRRCRSMGWLFSAGGLGLGVAALGHAGAAWTAHRPVLESWGGAGTWLGNWVWMSGMLAASVVLLLMPEGHVSGWRRPAVAAVVAAVAVRAMLSAFTGSTASDPISGDTLALANPLAVSALEPLVWPMYALTFVVLSVTQAAGAVRLMRRWRRADGDDRKYWAVLAVAAWSLPLPWAAVPVVGTWLDALALPAFAVAVAVFLSRAGSADADVVFSRTFLWASLTTCVVAVYLLVVTLLAALLQRAGGASVAVAASGVVALLAAPLRARLQRSVDRAVYGARADPYASVAELSRRLEGGVSSNDVLPAVVTTITEQLKLPYAAFRLAGLGEDSWVECGTPRGELVVLPVEYLGDVVGQLVVSTPAHGVTLRPAESRLLADLARQSGAAAHGVATIAELRRSRDGLVAARAEERQSLRRELHDDLGATLTGVVLSVDAAGNEMPAGSPAAEQLGRVRMVASAAVDDLRRIIEGLRPVALDELGLVAAIQDRLLAFGQGVGPKVQIEAMELPALPPAVEVAAYYVAVEAIHNAIRHAAARYIAVTLEIVAGRLQLRVVDDGHGQIRSSGSGNGLTTMRQRVEEVGGRFDLATGSTGTTISASFPTGSPT